MFVGNKTAGAFAL